MEIEIRHVRRRTRGTVSTQSERLSGSVLTIGRASHHDLHLPDPRLILDQAEIREIDGKIRYTTSAPEITLVDGKPTAALDLVPGVVINVGPYELSVLEPSEGDDLVLMIELKRPLDDGAEIMRRSHAAALARSDRWLRWISAASLLGLLGLILVWPLWSELSRDSQDVGLGTWERAQPLGRPSWKVRHIWTVGTLTRSHGFLEQQCEACHAQPFKKVASESCATCHADVAHHADPEGSKEPKIQHAACGSCHREHNSGGGIIIEAEAFCAQCHQNPQLGGDGVELAQATDFGADHPPFKPLVVTNSRATEFTRVTLAPGAKPKEASGLSFPHHVHLSKQTNTKLGPKAERALACVECHEPTTDGPGLRPIKMVEHCKECHTLDYQVGTTTRELPHGDPLGVQLLVSDLIQKAENEQARLQLKYGSAGKDPAKFLAGVQDRVQSKTADALSIVFSNVCGACHTSRPAAEDSDQAYTIDPVIVQHHWLRKARFDHRGHETVSCTNCHAAKTSTKSSDVLLPTIETCRTCHGGQEATDRVKSTCILCHGFHNDDLPAMVEK